MRSTILIGTLLLPLAAWSADEIKPFDVKLGLWETTSTSEMTGMPAMPAMPQIPEETLAKMPPEQRARVEAMLKSRGGIGSPRTSTTKVCMTKESLDRALSFANSEKSCTMKVVSSTPSKQVVHMDCAREGNHMTGDTTFERMDAEHAKGSSVMKAEGDHPITMKVNFQTKWLSSDCGDVKPIAPK